MNIDEVVKLESKIKELTEENAHLKERLGFADVDYQRQENQIKELLIEFARIDFVVFKCGCIHYYENGKLQSTSFNDCKDNCLREII